MKILLLEDDLMLNQAIKKYLETTGHVVDGFRDGQIALNTLKKESFDLLILDINVPNVDGLTLLEKLYDTKTQTPAIFISALIDIEDISRAFELGCYDYLKKPFHLKELSIRIDKMLKIHKTPQEHTRLSDGYSYNKKTDELLLYNKPQIIPKRQLQIINLLSVNCGNVVEYNLFREYVYNNNEIDNATIIAEVNRLKNSLKEGFILNIRSIGYIIKRR
ncbi:MAG: response regulator transcription factor [Campylobacterota bacterium]|nr:response regulator transcription factor [Campylobacterota bacterium]